MRLISVLGLAAAAGISHPIPLLRTIDGYDSSGETLRFQSPWKGSDDYTLRRVFVDPNATRFTLDLKCDPGQKLFVNGEKSSKEQVVITRDPALHNQVVEVVCAGKGASKTTADKQKYIFLVSGDYKTITAPDLHLGNVGLDCTPHKSIAHDGRIVCPNPKTPDQHVSVIPTNLLGDVQYTIESSDGTVQYRLLEGKATPPFPYNKSYKVRALAGQNGAEWPVSFGGAAYGSLLGYLGSFLAICLGLLLLALLLVVGTSSVIGEGYPLGHTEVASALALTVQYFTFANKLRGSNATESMATPLKWMSMFWPSPIIPRENTNINSANGPAFARAHALQWNRNADSSAIGDVVDINNVWGCMVWCIGILALFTLGHCLIVSFIRSGAKSGYTVPHRYSLGNWESQLINLLCLPLAFAATIGMLHPDTAPWIIGLGACTLAVLFVWLMAVLLAVGSAVNNGEVAWVWESSIRENGPNRKEEMKGYWSDVECDQLLTQPVSRAIAGHIFEYRWVNTVADIEPVNIYSTASPEGTQKLRKMSFSSANSSSSLGSLLSAVLRPVPKLKKSAHRNGNYLLAKNPHVVMVEQGRKPCCFLRGSRLMAGVLRTKWLDLMFTFEGLTNFLNYETLDRGTVSVPLLVKTQQLSGPLTNGANAYFFDGVRIPFIRIAESFWKILLGVLLGIAVSANLLSTESRAPFVCYLSVAIISAVMMTYVLMTKPYTRCADNMAIATISAVIAGSAAAMTMYNYNQKSCLADLFLWLTIFCACGLALYAIYMIASMFTAVLCPPLDESKFLEKLANCTVHVAFPLDNCSRHREGSSPRYDPPDEYDLPAYSKYAARDIVAKSTSNRAKIHRFGTFEDLDLHFDHAEIAEACRTGVLPIP